MGFLCVALYDEIHLRGTHVYIQGRIEVSAFGKSGHFLLLHEFWIASIALQYDSFV